MTYINAILKYTFKNLYILIKKKKKISKISINLKKNYVN